MLLDLAHHGEIGAGRIEAGGMPLLGLNGISIIAHGGASAYAMKNAIRMACDTISHQVNPHIEAAISQHLLIHANA